jgi:PTH1 family peptidyl-tRNA hydrolase
MRSITEHVGNGGFPRVRIGIGRNPDMDLADYVLQKFSLQERDKIDAVIEKAAEACIEIISKNVDSAMQKYNKNSK